MPRYIDVDVLWRDVTSNIEDCGDVLEIIERQPVVTINDTAKEIIVTNCNHNADGSKKVGRYTFGNNEFNLEFAYHDCKLVFDGITDDDSFQEADTGLILYYANEIIYALHEALQGKDTNVPSKDVIYRQDAIDALNEYFARIGKLKRRGLTKGEKAISLDTVGAIKTLPSAQPNACENTCEIARKPNDLISRQDAIGALIAEGRNVDSRYLESERIIHEADAVEVISMLPPAQSKRTDKRTETHACDLISRQALCEYALNQKDKSVTPNDIMRFPSAQPEPNCSEFPNGSDAISRADVIDVINNRVGYLEVLSGDIYILRDETIEKLKDLPPAQPTYTDAEIQKMQDLESAEIEKAYELGYEEGKKDGRQERTGNWVEIGDEPYDEWECDKCGFVIDGSGCIDPEEYRDIYIFCPHCGSMMLKEGEEQK